MDKHIHIQTENISWTPSGKKACILNSISFTAKKSECIGILGPNGSGKTSLLRCLYRSLTPDQGSVFFDGKNINNYKAKDLAKTLAVVLQESPADIPLNVNELLKLGRIPHRRFLSKDRKHYNEHEEQINFELDINKLLHRSYKNLSGGEKQRVMIARALYQKPKLLILDEPTNHLDIAHQISIMQYLNGLDITVICSLHDLNLASQYCDEVAIMQQGKLISQGEPDTVFNSELIKNTFSVNSVSDQHPITQSLRLSFY